jgi:hypothetical protein
MWGIKIAKGQMRKCGICMEIDYSNMKIDELESIYAKAERNLRKLLLNGAPWSEIRKLMLMVTQLSIALHKNKYPLIGNTYTNHFPHRK